MKATKRHTTRSPRWILAGLAALALVLAACEADDDPEAAPEDAPEGQEVVLFDGQWESLWILNEIITIIAEDGYGHDVDAPTTGTPVKLETMPDGEMDVAMEFWCMNYPDWCEEELFPDDSGIVYAGVIFEDSAQGWFVPRYVIEGDEEQGIEPMAPGLTSVDQLGDYADLFEDPESPGDGMLLGGIDGWEATEINRYKLEAYGLADQYNLQSGGSGAAFDAAIVSMIERGEPVLFYYWTPTWIPGTFDLVQLEEPAWTEECQAALDEALEAELDPAEVGPEVGCEFRSGEVGLGYYAELDETAPEIGQILSAIDGTFGTDLMNELTAFMTLEEAEPDEAALHFFEEWDIWRDWIPDDDALERIEAGLRDRGVDV